MNRIWLKGIILATLCAMGLTAPMATAQSASGTLKVGVINLKKVFDSYYKTVQSDTAFKTEVEQMDKELKDMVDDTKKAQEQYQSLFDNSNDQAISADERAKAKQAAEDKYRELASRKEAVDQYNRQAEARLQEEKRKKRDDLVAEIRDRLTVMAKAGGYNLVFDTSGESANLVPVAIYANGLPDLTDALIKELNVSAPASFTPPANAGMQTNQ